MDFDGRLLAQASPGPGERIVVAPVDISALRHERESDVDITCCLIYGAKLIQPTSRISIHHVAKRRSAFRTKEQRPNRRSEKEFRAEIKNGDLALPRRKNVPVFRLPPSQLVRSTWASCYPSCSIHRGVLAPSPNCAETLGHFDEPLFPPSNFFF